MQSRIDTCVSPHELHSCDWRQIHLIDWKKYTNENLKVHQEPQVHPITGEDLGSVCLYNENQVITIVDAFGDSALNYTRKLRSKQCECVVYPAGCDTEEWVLFVEMKYAESEFAALREDNDYPNRMLRQIIETVQFFREKEIIALDKVVHAIISFPNLLSTFNSSILTSAQIEDIYLDNSIILRASSRANIINSTELYLIG